MNDHVRERLSPFLDGELLPPERAAVEAHVESCAECAGLLEDLASVDALARALPAPAPAEGFESFPARVRARIAARPRPRRGLPVWSWAAAAALLLAVLTPLTLLPKKGPAPVAEPAASSVSIPPASPTATAPPTTAEDYAFADAPEKGMARYKREAGARATSEERARLAKSAEVARRDDASRREGAMNVPAVEPPASSDSEQTARLRQQRAANEAMTETVTMTGAAPAKPEAKDKKENMKSLGYVGGVEAKPEAAPPGAPPAPPPPPSPSPDADAIDRLGARESGVTAPKAAAQPTGRTKATPGQKAAPAEMEKDVGKDARLYDDDTWGRLSALPSDTLAAVRVAREAWRAYVRDRPQSPHADEARVRTIDLGLTAWQLSRDERDREVVRRDIAEYLERRDTRQAERVRKLRQRIEPR